MAAGTIISGGFPGRVAREVNPNSKCRGCLHYVDSAGRVGACSIGLQPWSCGDLGDAADIGYAPIAGGAGAYLPDMSNHGAHAPEVDPQAASELHGAGSARPLQIQQVTLGPEHVHFVKGFVAQHMELEQRMCRHHQGNGQSVGASPFTNAPQRCTCAGLSNRAIAKALASQLTNRQRASVSFDDVLAFVGGLGRLGISVEGTSGGDVGKGEFFTQHGKYESNSAGQGKRSVMFHPHGGGEPERVGVVAGHKEARRAISIHAKKFAAGSGTVASPTNSDPTSRIRKPDSAGAVSKALSFKPHPESPRKHVASSDHGEYEIQPSAHGTSARSHRLDYYPKGGGQHPTYTEHFSNYGEAYHRAQRHHDNVSEAKETVTEKSAESDEVQKSIDDVKHSHVVTGALASHGKGYSGRRAAQSAADKLDSKYGASAHSVSRNPNFKPKELKWEKHNGYGEGAHVAEAGHGRYVSQPERNGGHNITYQPHGQGVEGHVHGGWHGTPEAAHASAQQHHAKLTGG